MRNLLIILLSLCLINSFGQSADSLLLLLSKANTDTGKISAYNALTDYYIGDNNDSAKLFNDKSLSLSQLKKLDNFNFDGYYLNAQLKRLNKQYDSAMLVLNKAMNIAKSNSDTKNEAGVLRLIASIYEAQNGEKLALEKLLQSLELCEKAKDKDCILSSNISLGLYFKKHNNVTKGLEYFLEANKLAHEIHDSSSIFTCVINLGSLFELSQDNEKALELYREAMKINERDHDENGTAISSFKLGRIFYTLGKMDSSKYYLKQTLDIHMKRNDKAGLIFDYSFLATTYESEGDHKRAMENWNIALDLAIKQNDSLRANMVYSYIGEALVKRGDYEKALEYYNKSLNYACPQVYWQSMSNLYDRLAFCSEKLGMYKDAYEYHKQFKVWSDSSHNVSEAKKQTELKLGYEFNQVQEKLIAESQEKELKNKAELAQQQQQRNYLLIGLALISLLLVVAYRSYLTKQKAHALLQKQKSEIERQKKIVEEKNIEISDSINYALRIQTASLPEDKELIAYFPKHALFFRPKDVVSGDFYWAAGDEDISIIAIADCTGHGVPGAITSMIGSMLLNEIYYVKKLTRPDEILKELNRLVKLTLRQDVDSLSKDGMDIAVCLWNKKQNKLLYAGANRPIYIIHQGHLKEYKPSKVSVGGYVPLIQDYELNEIAWEKGDTLIMTSDGYADQFGGTKNKKLTTKSFKNLLEENSALPLEDKIKAIELRFDSWKSDAEQTDDVLVFLMEG